jgi:hypothetical protein
MAKDMVQSRRVWCRGWRKEEAYKLCRTVWDVLGHASGYCCNMLWNNQLTSQERYMYVGHVTKDC